MLYSKKIYALNLVILVILLSCNSTTSYSQVYGCKDPLANNYNPQATVNNGSCTYNTTTYTPPIKVDTLHETLIENSGIQMAGNYLWSFNDGGSAPAIYRIDTLTNTILQTVNLAGATNVDWEEIAFDGTHFYIGDFGNNLDGARTDLKIYKFPLSAIPSHTTNPNVTIPESQIRVINFTYSDQVQPPQPTGANNTRFDCEAMIIDAGKIHLFTKNWVDTSTTHYVIADTVAGSYVATPLETLQTRYLVTGADKAVGQEVIALLGYQHFGFGSHFMHFLSDYNGGLYFNGNKRRIDLPDATVMGQGEGITFRNGTYGYLSNERFVRSAGSLTLTVPARLRSFNAANFISATVLPIALKQFNAVNVQGSHKLSWSFESKVENLQLQHSTNGVSFNNIKTYNSSISDIYYTKPLGSANCYRLSWQDKSGSVQYSNNVCINTNTPGALQKASLKSNGELSFVIAGTEVKQYAFKLVSTDGKAVSETTMQKYNPGVNKAYFKNAALNGSLFLVTTGINSQETTLLQVIK